MTEANRQIFVMQDARIPDLRVAAVIFEGKESPEEVKAVFWNAYLTWHRAANEPPPPHMSEPRRMNEQWDLVTERLISDIQPTKEMADAVRRLVKEKDDAAQV